MLISPPFLLPTPPRRCKPARDRSETTRLARSTPTRITFYSYYYHLSTIHRYWKVGKKIYRKDPIGKSGEIYGNDGQIEIV